MATPTIPENEDHGPALALAILYEANDLLAAMRTVSEESSKPIGSAEWTLSSEIKRRIDSAISYLDSAVPEEPEPPANDGNAEPRSISGGDAHDDLMLTLERLGVLIQAISDVEMHGEDRNVVGLASMARQQIAAAERIARTAVPAGGTA